MEATTITAAFVDPTILTGMQPVKCRSALETMTITATTTTELPTTIAAEEQAMMALLLLLEVAPIAVSLQDMDYCLYL